MFDIKILRLHWINDDGKYDEDDICLHGEVYVKIGDETLSNKEAGSWSLSVTGLYLLRSLSQDCSFYELGNQLVPCCGHFMIPDDNGENYVTIMGCPSGIDWKITHKDSIVEFESEKGSKGQLSFLEYKLIVKNFINEIEDFYGKPEDKNVPDDEFDKNGFDQFWNEWRELKKQHNFE